MDALHVSPLGDLIEVRRGITRTVLLVGRWAIKVPSLRTHGNGARGLLWSVTRGISANLSEIEWSDTPAVCPVRWSLAGIVNVYPRCELVGDDEDIDYHAIGQLWPSDKKPENLGRLNGRLVWIDFDNSWNDCPHGHPRRPQPSCD